MNFSEFKKLLGADPWNRDPETLRARHSGPEFERAAAEAEAFERKLQRAVEIVVDETLLGELLEIPERPVARRLPPWMAMAASVLIVAGVAGTVWMQSTQPGTVEEYVARHYAHDGPSLFNRAEEGSDTAQISRVLSKLGVSAGSGLAEKIQFIKFCPTMDGRGAHMVVSTDHGPVQLIFMPNTSVEDGRDFRFDQMQAHLVSLARGSLAIIGRQGQRVSAMDSLVRSELRPLALDA